MSVDERLRQVFADVFGIGGDAVVDEDSPSTIDGWDSVTHLNLVLALEGEFMMQFEAEEIPELTTYRVIRERVAAAERTPV